MNLMAAIKLQRVFERIRPEKRHAIARDLLPILSKHLPTPLVKEAIEAIRDLLQ